MADSSVQITEGIGKLIDTRTESGGNHRQVVVIGDPSSGVAPVDDTAGLKVNLGGDNDVSVTGTVTANLSATDNAVLDAIQTATEAIQSGQLSDDHNVTVSNQVDQPLTDTQLRATAVPVTGTFYQATQPVSLASVPSHAVTNAGTFATQATLQAGTALVGKISASQETSTLYNGTTALTPKFKVIDNATSGDNTIVAAVSSKKIRVLSCFFNVAADVTVRFESGASGTALTGQMQIKAGSGFVLPYSPLGWFETASNMLLNLELSGAVSVDGSLVYVEV